MPSMGLVAIGLWWNANTIAHNFIHRPFFRSRAINRLYSCALSLLLGFPQTIWRQRHLAHHAGRVIAARPTPLLLVETALVFTAWGVALAMTPRLFLLTYLPGWALGLALCTLQGHYEHAGGTTSHYGWIYNRLFFNDGYHVEHHQHPGVHWTEINRSHRGVRRQAAESEIPIQPDPDHQRKDVTSRWPPVLRWLDALSLEGLERLVLHLPLCQRAVIAMHVPAFRRLLANVGEVRSVLIVGGGLFPRSALVLRRLLPDATLTIVDASETHLAIARRFLDSRVTLRTAVFCGSALPGIDLVVVPLAYIGDRGQLYAHPPARLTLVHDWLWRPRGASAIVSVLLLKRLNLITLPGAERARGIAADDLTCRAAFRISA
jgi:fatty acid desaturase